MGKEKQLCAALITALMFQFVSSPRCFATEAEKTEQKADAAKTEAAKADPVAVTPPEGMLPTPLLSLRSQTGAFSQYAFLVDKKARTLTVWQTLEDKVKLVGAWPTDIGQRDGDKLVQGDRRTPEGIYFFQSTMDGHKVDFSQYGARIFTLDYPNYFDRLEKKTGNGIWFHAIPDTKSLLRGSRGCVVVRNSVIEELSKFIELKRTPMLIVGQVDYVTPEKWLAQKRDLNNWVEAWRQSWMGKNLDAYMAQYSDRFHSLGMNKSRWRLYKENLAERYKFIDVDLKDVQIFNLGSKIVVRFLQNYKSDQKEDFGSKVIYALKEGPKYEIVGETWEPYHEAQTAAAKDR